ncbi:MAG TPA: aquaporin [Gemmatimonadales bacterium]
MNSKTLRPLIAECIGMALFVFVGAGSVVANAMGGGRLSPTGTLVIAAAHGLAMAVLVSCTMGISGGHINPAVTFGLWIARKIDPRTAVGYVIAQLVGAVVGAALLPLVFPAPSVRAMSYGTPLLSPTTTLGQGIVIEAVMTFFLVSAVFGTLVSRDAPKIGGFGVGLAILACGLVGGAATGAAMNPARAFGPAMVSFTFTGQIVYWIGPLAGAALAGLIWGKILLPKDV